ncbi:hypothetical protein C5G84_02145 [Salmonella enterica]|nr:hypothetical protein [Salmonella enterica]EEC2906526.1 hypothetical protein [Salmonella enterica]
MREPMSYIDAVLHLQVHYQELWFWTGTTNPVADVRNPKSWNYALIFSPGGKFLASQDGDANQWLLEKDYRATDSDPVKEDPEGCVVLTASDFACAAGEMLRP